MKSDIKHFIFPTLTRQYLIRIILVAVLAYLLFSFIFLPFRIKGHSMSPTYKDGDINFCFKLRYIFSKPERHDVVAIRLAGEKVILLKRVVALEGELIEIQNQGKIFRSECFVENQYFGRGERTVKTFPLQYDFQPDAGKQGGHSGYLDKIDAMGSQYEQTGKFDYCFPDKGHLSLLEAFAQGKPVLATTAAMDGIRADGRCRSLTSDDPRRLAEMGVELLRRGDSGGVGAAGRALVLGTYGWAERLSGLGALLGDGSQSALPGAGSVDEVRQRGETARPRPFRPTRSHPRDRRWTFPGWLRC